MAAGLAGIETLLADAVATNTAYWAWASNSSQAHITQRDQTCVAAAECTKSATFSVTAGRSAIDVAPSLSASKCTRAAGSLVIPIALADDAIFNGSFDSIGLTHQVCRPTNEASHVRKAQD
jgi:hypothetical protein